MGRDAQDRVVLSDEAKKKFEDCVAAIAACGFGPDGPPIDTARRCWRHPYSAQHVIPPTS